MAGIYIHIPFCKKKCTYCDFHFSTTFESYRKEMIAALCNEIQMRSPAFFSGEPLTTIYFGGGTPSLLTPEELETILTAVHQNNSTETVEEITLEANPDDITEENLTGWKKAGINRLSIGLQSFREQDLQWMNRAHSVEEGESAIRKAQKFGFTNLTVDLMYGLPDLSQAEWKEHIYKLTDLNVPHISAYCLTVEPKTTLHHLVGTNKIHVPDEDIQAEQFELLIQTLREKGYEHYEISNFCLPGQYAKHNSNYWKNRKYLGIGPSAHSYDGENRFWNPANNTRYIQSVQSGEHTPEKEHLSPENRFNELLLTGLRTIWGVDLQQLSATLPLTDAFRTEMEHFIQAGDLQLSGNTIRLTQQGKLKADYIASALFV